VVGHVQDRAGQVAQAFVGVDDHPRSTGPQRLENPGDVARHDGVRLRRQAWSGEDFEAVGMGQQVLVEDLVEVVSLGLDRKGVADREIRPEAQRGRDFTELKVEVEEHHQPVGVPSEELRGVGGQERLPAAARCG
jgi:hypothetical protein